MEESNKKKLENLPRKIKLKIQNNEYEVEFPNQGQLIDIETNKILYSQGQYMALIRQNNISSNLTVDLIEIAATFPILIPELKKDLKTDSIFELDIISCLELTEVYNNDFLPWYNSWWTIIKSIRTPKGTAKKEEKNSTEDEPQVSQ